MKKIKIFFIILFLSLIFNFQVFAVDYSKSENNLSDADKYFNCELGDLVGEDVVRLRIAKYYVDYHSEDFKAEQINKFAQECLNEGIKTQYQMDCCLNLKMYPKK